MRTKTHDLFDAQLYQTKPLGACHIAGFKVKPNIRIAFDFRGNPVREGRFVTSPKIQFCIWDDTDGIAGRDIAFLPGVAEMTTLLQIFRPGNRIIFHWENFLSEDLFVVGKDVRECVFVAMLNNLPDTWYAIEFSRDGKYLIRLYSKYGGDLLAEVKLPDKIFRELVQPC